MTIYQELGKMAIGSRLRRLSEVITDEAAKIYQESNIDLEPRWFPIFHALSKHEAMSITEIADYIGHSHPSVSKMVKQMTKAGIVDTTKGSTDGRKNVITLSKKGLSLIPKFDILYRDFCSGVEEVLGEMTYDIWKAIEEMEFLFEQESLYSRLNKIRKKREAAKVEIVDFEPRYKNDFKTINQIWIEQNFTMEEEDYKALVYPEEKILNPGGHILIALYEGKPVGTCALIKMDDTSYELAKMGVLEEAKGKSIGYLLGLATIEKAREIGAKRIFLESNTKLTPAINLYFKLGFKKITGEPSPYQRCNIQMEMFL